MAFEGIYLYLSGVGSGLTELPAGTGADSEVAWWRSDCGSEFIRETEVQTTECVDCAGV